MRDEMWVLLDQDCHVPRPILERESDNACLAWPCSWKNDLSCTCYGLREYIAEGVAQYRSLLALHCRCLFELVS